MVVPVPNRVPISRRYVTVNEAANYLSCHPRTVRKRIAAGEIRAYRWKSGGGAIRIDLTDLDALLAPMPAAPARTQPTTGGAA